MLYPAPKPTSKGGKPATFYPTLTQPWQIEWELAYVQMQLKLLKLREKQLKGIQQGDKQYVEKCSLCGYRHLGAC